MILILDNYDSFTYNLTQYAGEINSNIIVKKQFKNVTVAGSQIADSQFSIGADFTFMPFTPQRYVISYGDGSHEPLTADQVQISNDSKTLNFVNLSVGADSQTRVDVSLKKNNPSSKEKRWTAGTTVITRSNKVGSGTTSQSLQNGLTYSNLYGTRVEDKDISLNVPDVVQVLGIYESNDMTDPDLPSITLSSLSGPNGTTADLTVGEEIISSDGAVAVVIEITSSTQLGIAYVNDTKFNIGENINISIDVNNIHLFDENTGKRLN